MRNPYLLWHQIIASREGGSFDIEVSSSSEVYTLEELTNCTVRFSGQSSGNLPAAIYIHGVRKSLVSVTSGEFTSSLSPVVLFCCQRASLPIPLSGQYSSATTVVIPSYSYQGV